MSADHRFFADQAAALQCIRSMLAHARDVRIATAYFEASGYQVLQDALRGKRVRLLVGRPEGGEDRVREMLNEFLQELSTGLQENRTHALRDLLDALKQGWMTVAVSSSGAQPPSWLKAGYTYHHAKLYIADADAAVVTSANFTRHGLCQSRESGYVVARPEDVAFFVERFDHYFAQALSITQELIEALEAWLRQYDPYIIYARALLELYDVSEETVPPTLPPLADYQKGAASSVLHALRDHGGAFFVASTGLGKTVIAAHVAAYLRMHNDVHSVIVICPAGMRQTWRRWMRAARLSSAEFSYHTLRRKDRDSNLPALESELSAVARETLIILDESHHLRNEDGDNGVRLSNRRIQDAVRKNGAKILLLTATPYGKDIKDVQSQLELLPVPKVAVPTRIGLEANASKWAIQELRELSDLPICTVLSMPDVVRYFGQQDENGDRFVLFGEKERYFPHRIRMELVRYDNPFDDFFADLLESKLLYKAAADDEKKSKKRRTTQEESFLDRLFPEEEHETFSHAGERLPLQEASFLHQFCSSPAEALDVCQNLKEGAYSYPFARQRELTAFVEERERALRRWKDPTNDPKFQKLMDIIHQHKTEKAVIFCEYHATATYVADSLKKLDPNLRVATTVDQSDANLEDILRCFAPIANDARDVQNELRVLVATRAVSEGYNLQDASVLINYDLPWTVLQLAQRMGRILRPWETPRAITIYHFVPSTMSHSRISHARNWDERLKRRSNEHRSLAQIPVMVHDESRRERLSREFEMEAFARELSLTDETRADLNLDEALAFVSHVEGLRTSDFYLDLSGVRDPDAIRRLPGGIRSAMAKMSGQKRLFLLVRHGRNRYPILADRQGRPLPESGRRDAVMRAIRCTPETSKAPFDEYPDDDTFDQWIEQTRRRWAENVGISPDSVQIVCALALV